MEKHDDWFNDKGDEKNLQAKEAIYVFYKELLRYKPAKDERSLFYYKRTFDEQCAARALASIKQAFKEQKYMRAANEIITLMHYEPGGRMGKTIHESLKKLLEEELSL